MNDLPPQRKPKVPQHRLRLRSEVRVSENLRKPLHKPATAASARRAQRGAMIDCRVQPQRQSLAIRGLFSRLCRVGLGV